MLHSSTRFSLLSILVCAACSEFFVEAALRPRPWRYFGDGDAEVLMMDKRSRYDVLDPMSDDIHAISRRRWASEDGVGEGAWSRGSILNVDDMNKRGRYDVLDPMSDDIHAINKRLWISNDYEGSNVHLGAKRGRYDVLDPMSDDIHAINKRQFYASDDHEGIDREDKRTRYDVLDPMSYDIHAINKRQFVHGRNGIGIGVGVATGMHHGHGHETKRSRYDVLDPMSDDIHAISKRRSFSDADKETLRMAVHLAQILEAARHEVSAEEKD